MHENINKTIKELCKNALLYNVLFWYYVTTMFITLCMQYLLNVDVWMFKSIFMQNIFILSYSFYENVLRYSFMNFKLCACFNLFEVFCMHMHIHSLFERITSLFQFQVNVTLAVFLLCSNSCSVCISLMHEWCLNQEMFVKHVCPPKLKCHYYLDLWPRIPK